MIVNGQDHQGKAMYLADLGGVKIPWVLSFNSETGEAEIMLRNANNRPLRTEVSRDDKSIQWEVVKVKVMIKDATLRWSDGTLVDYSTLTVV